MTDKKITRKILKSSEDGHFWDIAKDSFDVESRNNFCQAVIELHNSGRINFLEKLMCHPKQDDMYYYRSIFQETIPFLNKIELKDLFDIISVFIKICNNPPIECFEKYLRNNIDQVDDILMGIIDGSKEFHDLLSTTLNVMSSIDIEKAQTIAFEYTEHNTLNLQLNSIRALGEFDYSKKDDLLSITIEFICNELKKGSPKERYEAVLRVCRNLQNQTNDKRILDCILFFTQEKWSLVSEEIIYILWVNNKHLGINIINSILEQVLNQGLLGASVHYLDYGLLEIFSREESIAVEFLKNWIIRSKNGNDNIEQLDSVFRYIAKTSRILSYFLTMCFASDHSNLHEVAAKLFERLEEKQKITLDIDFLNGLSKERIYFMMRKIIGYCLLYPYKISYIFMSFLKIKHSKTYIDSIFFSLYYEFLGINYGGAATAVMNEILDGKPSKREKQVISDLKKELDKYYQALREIPNIPELNVDIELRKIYREAERKQHNRIQKKASSNFLFSIFSTSILLHGQSFFYEDNIFKHNSEKTDKIELSSASKLGHIEKTWEFARMTKFDPMGLDMVLFKMKTETFEELDS